MSPGYSHARDIQDASPEMIEMLKQLREKVVIGFVGGSDLVKQQEQLGQPGVNGLFLLVSSRKKDAS